MSEGAWQTEAACGGMDPELFFPGRGEDARESKAVCAECPVTAECLDFSLTSREKFGIWGGLSERERRRIRRSKRVGLVTARSRVNARAPIEVERLLIESVSRTA